MLRRRTALTGAAALGVAVATWLWVQYLPGYVLSRVLVPDAAGLHRHALALFREVREMKIRLERSAVVIQLEGRAIWLVSSHWASS